MDTNNTIVKFLESEIINFFTDHGISSAAVSFERPSDFKHGDISSNIALKYAKAMGKYPYKLAQDIRDHISKKQLNGIEKIEAVAPGFINVFFDKEFFNNILSNILKLQSNFGKNDFLKNQKWVVEHTSPNPNKAMHLGHLRNNLVGMGLVRLLLWNGADVVSDAVDNDRGIAIAKLMWGFLSHMRKNTETEVDINYWESHQDQWYTPQECSLLPDVFVTKCYVLGEMNFKNNPDIEAKVRELVVSWEANDKKVWKLWSYILSIAYDGIQRTLTRLGNHWDKVWHEHEHYQEGKKYIQKGLELGVFKKLEDGAVLTGLSNYNLPDTILLKRDGTSLYITQDIALTAIKKNYYNAQKLIWVIGPEQSLAMKQLFAVCEQLGIGAFTDFTHVSYGYVGLKDDNGGFKKMSSREGTVILIDDVIDNVKDKILQRFITEKKDANKDLQNTAEKLALAAVKFSILKSDRTQDLVFDIDQSIATTGDSGIYVMYAYVRTQSILRKKHTKKTWGYEAGQKLGSESELVKLLTYFPEIVKRAQEDFSVHHIAQYLLEICSAFNAWYSKETVLDGSTQEDYKLAVTECIGITIRNGLSILGIETIEEM